MEPVHLHLMLNHVPVLGVVFGSAVGVIALLAKSKAVVRVALGMFVFSAMIAVPVYLTGEPAEEIVERLAGVSEAVIEPHESAAALSLVLAGVTGGLALLALLLDRWLTSRQPAVLTAATVLAALLTTGSMLWTANLGGQIRHSEIRASTTNGTTEAPATSSEKTRQERDDDDD